MDGNLKILIADDHDLIREGLKLTVDGMYSQAILIEASTAGNVYQALSDHPGLDLIILDLLMPGVVDRMELLVYLSKSHPDIPVVVLSADESPQTKQSAIELGAVRFIPKSAANDEIIRVLKLVLPDSVQLPVEVSGKAVNTDKNSAKTEDLRPSENTGPGLTRRQEEVLVMLANGESNKSIAQKLALSEHTIKVHVSAIFKVLGVKNRTEAALACRGLGLLQK